MSCGTRGVAFVSRCAVAQILAVAPDWRSPFFQREGFRSLGCRESREGSECEADIPKDSGRCPNESKEIYV
jgi:hypothetical protein